MNAEKNSTEQQEQNSVQETAKSNPIVSRKEAIEMGLTRYFTGKPCKHGHIAERIVSQTTCLECKRFRDRNPSEKRKEYLAEYEKTEKYKKRKRIYEKQDHVVNKKRECDKKRYHKDVAESRKKAMDKYHKNREIVLKNKSIRCSERLKADPNFKAINTMRMMVHRILKFIGKTKDKGTRTENLIGYSRVDLIKHLESQFLKGMRWDNHGILWEIDHITPVSVMIKNGETDPKVINCLTNLIPIYKKENRSKGSKEVYLI